MLKNLPLTINKKLFGFLFLGFILATIVGTLSFAVGGFIVAKSLGIDAGINYQGYRTRIGEKELWEHRIYLINIQQKYHDELKNNIDFPEKSAYEQQLLMHKTAVRDNKYMHYGATGFPIIIGTFGFIHLFLFRRKYQGITTLNFKKWFFIFVTLFWLRSMYVLFGSGIYLSIAYPDYHGGILPFNNSAFIIITGLFGTIVLKIVVFKFIPISERLTFLLSGFAGGIIGFGLWFSILGKYLLP